MSKKLRVGIVGYGWVATAHIPAINASGNAEVTAVYSSRALDAAELSRKWGSEIGVFNDFDSMLASDIDVVSICSYPYQHREQAVKAAKAGKHLIIEKPLALTAKDCEAIDKAVKQAKVKTCVCFECRFSNQFQTIKAAGSMAGFLASCITRRSRLLSRHRPMGMDSSAGTPAKMPAVVHC